MIKEIRIQFQDGNKTYEIIHIKRLFKRPETIVIKIMDAIEICGIKANAVKVLDAKISASTVKEVMECWLIRLQLYLIEKRRKKRG